MFLLYNSGGLNEPNVSPETYTQWIRQCRNPERWWPHQLKLATLALILHQGQDPTPISQKQILPISWCIHHQLYSITSEMCHLDHIPISSPSNPHLSSLYDLSHPLPYPGTAPASSPNSPSAPPTPKRTPARRPKGRPASGARLKALEAIERR